MNGRNRQLAIAVALAGSLAAGQAMAQASVLDTYPNAEEQIREYFQANFGQSSANCGPGEINNISNAEVVSETDQQLVLEVDYTFSARTLQGNTRCHGDDTRHVTFDKSPSGLTISQMSGIRPQ
jgi:hypothetical protein